MLLNCPAELLKKVDSFSNTFSVLNIFGRGLEKNFIALKDFGNKVADITKILQGLKINHQKKKIFYTGLWKKYLMASITCYKYKNIQTHKKVDIIKNMLNLIFKTKKTDKNHLL